MKKTEIIFKENGFGEIVLFSSERKIGEMAISVRDRKLTVYHTEVYPESKAMVLRQYCSNGWLNMQSKMA